MVVTRDLQTPAKSKQAPTSTDNETQPKVTTVSETTAVASVASAVTVTTQPVSGSSSVSGGSQPQDNRDRTTIGPFQFGTNSAGSNNFRLGSRTATNNAHSPDFFGFDSSHLSSTGQWNYPPATIADVDIQPSDTAFRPPQLQSNRNISTADDKLDRVTAMLGQLVEAMNTFVIRPATANAQLTYPATAAAPVSTPVSYALTYRPSASVPNMNQAGIHQTTPASTTPVPSYQQPLTSVVMPSMSTSNTGAPPATSYSTGLLQPQSVANNTIPTGTEHNSGAQSTVITPFSANNANSWPWSGFAPQFWQPMPQQPQPLRNLKPPQVHRANVELDLACLESYMTASGVLSDEQRSATLIAAIDSEIRWAIQTHITNPPAVDHYPTMKNAILSHFRESEEQRLNRLIAGVKLTGRAVTMLSEMRALYKGPDNEILRRMFLDKLPPMVQMLLKGIASNRAVGQLPMSLEELATHADIYMETLNKSNLNSINAVESAPNQIAAVAPADSDADLRRRIERILRDMRPRTPSQDRNQDTKRNDDRPQRGRSGGRGSNSNRSQHRSPTPKGNVKFYENDNDVCYFHKRWSEGKHENRRCLHWCRLNSEWRQQNNLN